MYERKKSNQAFSMCDRRHVHLDVKNRAMRQEGNVAHTGITRNVFRIIIRIIH
jgi:hypothetical protein